MPVLTEGPNAGKSWKDFLGRYDVIYTDMTVFVQTADELQYAARKRGETISYVMYLLERIKREIRSCYGDDVIRDGFSDTLLAMVRKTGRKIIWICDEWDLFFREEVSDPEARSEYIRLLRSLFKDGSGTMLSVFAGAYMTGIMPMLKVKGQSAVSEFDNYTMLMPGELTEYIGFTELEVQELCRRYHVSFKKMTVWYDGYRFPEVGSVYNPNSVMQAIEKRQFASYWTQTASYEVLEERINQNITDLREMIVRMLAGESVVIDPNRFTNQIEPNTDVDDELTLLAHLGYLSYDPETSSVCIPNQEIRAEFLRSLLKGEKKETSRLIRESDILLQATWDGKEEEVASGIEAAHMFITDPNHYNNERDLSAVVRMAYFTSRDHYMPFTELAGEKGFADIVFIPKKAAKAPLMIVELKWNRSVKSAIAQIKDRQYPLELQKYGGQTLLMVGITYHPKSKKHTCIIEKIVL